MKAPFAPERAEEVRIGHVVVRLSRLGTGTPVIRNRVAFGTSSDELSDAPTFDIEELADLYKAVSLTMDLFTLFETGRGLPQLAKHLRDVELEVLP